jgi:bis(5'-nucleosyl)-tetraphosphatase (symmetrical)
MALCEKLQLDETKDNLILLGDLVNRGAHSLAVLDDLMRRSRVQVVLGNHDLYLLGILIKAVHHRKDDTLGAVIYSPRKLSYANWLQNQRVVTADDRHLFVHGGLLPSWSDEDALQEAAQIESMLREHPKRLYNRGQFSPSLRIFTTIRVVDEHGALSRYSGESSAFEANQVPWFAARPDQLWNRRVFFGHWAALGLAITQRYVCLDTGAVWGGQLSAYCLETDSITSVPVDAKDVPQTPGG